MRKIWFDEAWEDYLYWQTQDKKTLRRINLSLKDIERGHFNGLGKPEPLKRNWLVSGAGVLMKRTGLCIGSAMACWKSFHAEGTMRTKRSM